MDSYITILSLIWLSASFILIFISEKPFQNFLDEENKKNFEDEEKHLTMTETIIKIRSSFKNKNLRGFIAMLLFSKIGLIFSTKISPLIFIEKGFSQQKLTNLSSVITIIEILISIKLSNIKENFLKVYLNSYRTLFFVFGFEMIILISYEFFKEKIEEFSTLFFIILGLHIVIKSYFYLVCFISLCGFFNRITDRSIGATYVTALYSANNLSEKWPGIFVFSLLDYVDYKIIGFLSIFYSICFYWVFKDKYIKYDESEEKDWISSNSEKSDKIE